MENPFDQQQQQQSEFFDATSMTITMNVANPAIENQAVIYTNTSSSLVVTLTNSTGRDMTLTAGCTMEVYMPDWFSADDLQVMDISNISQEGWSFSYDAIATGLLLTWGSTPGTWAAGATFSFTIAQVLTASQASTDTEQVQINFNGLSGTNVPALVTAGLALENIPVPNTDPAIVLDFEFEFQGTIYVSPTNDPITNALYLNVKNKGATPLYSGTQPWSGNPKITVSFVYGNTSGALSSAQRSDQYSAWNISGSLAASGGNAWTEKNPSSGGDEHTPSWIFSPAQSNQDIIGVGDNANITFEFSDIFSFTPPGATQAYVQFIGFRKDENTVYNDALFIVDIFKTNVPANRGISVFYGPPQIYIKAQPNTKQDVEVLLKWIGYYVDSIQITSNAVVPMDPYDKNYPTPAVFQYDETSLTIFSAAVGNVITFSITSYDENGNQIPGVPSFPVSIMQKPDIYAFSGPSAVNFTLNQNGSVTLNWMLYAVASVQITSSNAQDFTTSYPDHSLWITDDYTFSVADLSKTSAVTFTITAFDKKGNAISSETVTVQFVPNAWMDTRDNHVYPIVSLSGLTWMAACYDYNDTTPSPIGFPGSMFYNTDPTNEAQYGRLYQQNSMVNTMPQGWRLPTADDWEALISLYGNNNGPLMAGGSTGLNLQPGGFGMMDPGYVNGWFSLGQSGSYWIVTRPGDQATTISVDNGNVTISPITGAMYFYGSVIYVMENNPW